MEQIATTITTKYHVNHQHVFRPIMPIAVVRQLKVNEDFKSDW
jgi:hypothetical protein